jgi:tyrosyl-tRNA synthetase
MGKTEKGAVWINPEKTSPYEMYQYFRNVDDADVENCLALLTFLPMDEVRRLGALEGSEINKAKEVLAFEFTKLVHGEEEATKAQDAAKSLFSGGMNSSNIPSTDVTEADLTEGMDMLQVLCDIGFVKSRGEGKRLVKQGGIYINETQVTDFARTLTTEDLEEGKITIRKGKKSFHQLKV